MRPLSLTLENVGPFPSLDLTFADGVTALAGPNGAGKSTVLNAIELALFARGARDLAPLLGPFAEALTIALAFEHGGREYEVRRRYKSTGRGSSVLDFEEVLSVGRAPLTRETTAETQAEIERILGLSRATFNASAFLGQGNAAMFAEADPAERKAILGEVLDPRGLWPALAERARAEAREAEQGIAVARARIGELEARVAEKPAADLAVLTSEANQGMARALHTSADRALTQAQETLAANQAALERVKRLREAEAATLRDLERCEQEHAQAQRADVALADAREELAAVAKAAGRVPELERLLAEERSVVEAYAELVREKRAAKERADLADVDVSRAQDAMHVAQFAIEDIDAKSYRLTEEERPHCDRCQQVVGGEALEAALRSLTVEREGHRRALAEASEAVAAARSARDTARAEADAIQLPPMPVPDETVGRALGEARDAARQAAVLAERVGNLEQMAARLPDLAGNVLAATAALTEAREALAEAQAETHAIGDEGSLLRAVDVARVEVARCQRDFTSATETLTRARVAVEQLEDDAQALAALADETALALAGLDVLKLAERCFGRDGVPVLLLETVIPQIEAEACRVLALMPTAKGETFRVELRTLKNVKADDRLRETLDVVVYGAGDARAYETFSGGERGRLNVALRLALAHVLATRRGAEVRMLALDEVEYLDVLGQEQLVDVLRSVEAVFGCVLVVSHHPNVRDAFEQVVAIETDGNGASRIVGGRDAPAFDRLPTPEDGYTGHREAV